MKDVVLFERGKKEKNNNLGLWWHGRASTGTAVPPQARAVPSLLEFFLGFFPDGFGQARAVQSFLVNGFNFFLLFRIIF